MLDSKLIRILANLRLVYVNMFGVACPEGVCATCFTQQQPTQPVILDTHAATRTTVVKTCPLHYPINAHGKAERDHYAIA
ncbi:MAG: hypothetical protein KTR35_12115 [Gammaproteobacteria bacterium]|nr:hypothetical protein [Gammaproteobacteria bacterium]